MAAITLGALALTLAKWLIKRYGVKIAAATLVYMGISVGADVVEGVAEEYGRDIAKKLKQETVSPSVPPSPDAAHKALAFAGSHGEADPPKEKEQELDWRSVDAATDELLADECRAWEMYQDDCC